MRRARLTVYPLEVAGEQVEIGAVSMGNPHAVLTVASVDSGARRSLGPADRDAIRAFPSA